MMESNKIEPGKLFFARISYYDKTISNACSVQSVEEAEQLAQEAGVENDYGERWIVGFAMVRNVSVSYSLPSNGSNEAPKEAAVGDSEDMAHLKRLSPSEVMDLLRKRLWLSPAGQRNNTANRCGFSLGKMLGSGFWSDVLDEYEAQRQLVSAAIDAGLSEGEATAAIEAGIRTGIACCPVETAGSYLVGTLPKRSNGNA